jgi:CDP-glycerol glycerophosphotransferase (TagB/SpsB family)
MPLDLEFYKKNRGFELEPYEFWTPGKKVFDIKALREALLSNGLFEKEDIKNVKNIIFSFQDGFSSKRIFNIIKKDF